MIEKLEIGRNPFIGAFGIANEEIAFLSVDFTEKKAKIVEKILSTEVQLTTVSRTNLVGILGAGNTHGLVLPYTVEDHEIDPLKEADVNVEILSTKHTALGNLIACNDNGAVISTKLKEEAKTIEDALDVEVFIQGSHNYGSMILCTNHGSLVHPALTEETDEFEAAFDVEVDVGSANRGVYYLGISVLANTQGAVVGNLTTGPEMNKIEDIMF